MVLKLFFCLLWTYCFVALCTEIDSVNSMMASVVWSFMIWVIFCENTFKFLICLPTHTRLLTVSQTMMFWLLTISSKTLWLNKSLSIHMNLDILLKKYIHMYTYFCTLYYESYYEINVRFSSEFRKQFITELLSELHTSLI